VRIRDEAGAISGVVLVFRDQTLERKAQRELQESRDLLHAVVENSSDPIYLKDPDGRYLLFNAAAALTRQLLAFSRRQILTPTVLDLNAAVANTEAMLRRVIGENIRLETHLAPNLRPVRADAGNIDQIILNLVVNSGDALPKGGHITVRTANVSLSETTDIVLPDGDGYELAEAFHARNPALAMLLTSGYTDERSRWGEVKAHGFHFLQKPYPSSELLGLVRRILD
jgi:signal transduction histidine kinase